MIHDVLQSVAEPLEPKMGKAAQPLCAAVSDGPTSPPTTITVALLDRETKLALIERALGKNANGRSSSS